MIRIKILYDNNLKERRFISAWGFSCFIEEKKILFDTGGQSSVLFHNMKELKVPFENIEHIFISHIHGDHTGSLIPLVKKIKKVKVWIPENFPEELKIELGTYGARIKNIKGATKLFENVYSTGIMGKYPPEQSLLIDTKRGIILIVGCSHPGILNIATKAKNILNKKIHLILGGLHLRGYPRAHLFHIISLLKNETERIAPCHCTGEDATEIIKEVWKEGFIEVAVGTSIEC